VVLDIDPLELTKGIVEGREQELPVKLADEDLGPAEALLEDPEGGKPELTTLEHVHHNVVVEVAQLGLHLAPEEQAVEAQLDERPLGVHQRSVAPIDERALLLVLRLQNRHDRLQSSVLLLENAERAHAFREVELLEAL